LLNASTYIIIQQNLAAMGASCSKVCQSFEHASLEKTSKHKLHSSFGHDGILLDVHDQQMHKLMKQSLDMYTNRTTLDDLDRDKELVPILSVKIPGISMKSKRANNDSGDSWCGQYHLLFKHQQKSVPPSGNGNNASRRTNNKTSTSLDKENTAVRLNIRHQIEGRPGNEGESIRSISHETIGKQMAQFNKYPTRLVQRRQTVRPLEEGMSGNHVYAVRWPAGTSLGYGQEGSEEDDCLERKHLMGQQEQCPRYRKNNNSSDRFKNSSNSKAIGQNMTTTTNISSNIKQKHLQIQGL
jgi:hypothetical protein